MTLKLKIFEKEAEQLIYEELIPSGTAIKVGRNPELTDLKQVRLHDRRISQKHFQIEYDNETVTITDLNSRNGTWFDGKEQTRVDLVATDFDNQGLKFFAGQPEKAKYYFLLELESLRVSSMPGTVRNDLDSTPTVEDEENEARLSPRWPPPRRSLEEELEESRDVDKLNIETGKAVAKDKADRTNPSVKGHDGQPGKNDPFTVPSEFEPSVSSADRSENSVAQKTPVTDDNPDVIGGETRDEFNQRIDQLPQDATPDESKQESRRDPIVNSPHIESNNTPVPGFDENILAELGNIDWSDEGFEEN